MMINRRTLIAIGAISFASSVGPLAPVAIFANEPTKRVSGGKGKWVAELQGNWLGGNAKEIESDLNRRGRTDDPIIKALRDLLSQAQQQDAVFSHYEFDRNGKNGWNDASIKINLPAEDKFDYSDEKVFSIHREFLKMLFGSGFKAAVEVEWHKTSTTAGFPSYATKFRIKYSDGSLQYVVNNLVKRDNQRHEFNLSGVPETYEARFKEFEQMLQSVQYLL